MKVQTPKKVNEGMKFVKEDGEIVYMTLTQVFIDRNKELYNK